MTYNLAEAFRKASTPAALCVGAVTVGLSNGGVSLLAGFIAGLAAGYAMDYFADGLETPVAETPDETPEPAAPSEPAGP